jgi:1,4-dihydroxy-2-naphthoate octaprenyltransferase
VLVGSALAARDDAFDWLIFTVILFAALAIQVGVNFANDLADAARGADGAERIGPARAVATGLLTAAQMKRGIVVAFGLAALAGVYLISVAGWVVLVIGIVSIIAALGYTNGPVPYGYRGMGELFVFVFFGLVATVGTRYVFDRSAPADAWVSGIVMGLLAAAILEANNIRDIDTDRTAGKRTLAVVLGRTTARRLFAATVIGAFLVLAAGIAFGVLPIGMSLAFLAAPFTVPLIRTAATETAGPPLIRVLKGTARLQLAVAVGMSLGALV